MVQQPRFVLWLLEYLENSELSESLSLTSQTTKINLDPLLITRFSHGSSGTQFGEQRYAEKLDWWRKQVDEFGQQTVAVHDGHKSEFRDSVKFIKLNFF